MSQMSQPIPHVTTNSNESSNRAPNQTPLPHGTAPAPALNEPELFDGGGGGGEENGSDIEVSFRGAAKNGAC
jgi:hypothetical protein